MDEFKCECVFDEDPDLDYICGYCEDRADENAARPCESCGGEKGYVSGKLCLMCRHYENEEE